MKNAKILTILVLVLGLVVWLVQQVEATPMGTAWTYQGRLMDDSSPADGLYDFQFKLFDDWNVADGNQVGSDVNVPDVDVIDGYFTVELDFGVAVFDGNARWLEIGVRPGDSNDPNAFVTLSPRQEITPTPYALQTRGIFVDPNGNVGIGTRSPVGKLHVGTPSTYGDVIFFDAGSGLNDLSVDHGSAYTDNIDRIYLVEVTAEGSFEKPDKFKWSDDNGVTWSSEINMIRGWHNLSHGVRVRWFNTSGHSDGGALTGDTWAWAAFYSRENSLVVTDGKVGIGTASPAWELDVTNPMAGDGAEVGVTANDASGAIAAYSSTLGAPFAHYAGRVSLFAGLETSGLDLRADGGTGYMRFYTGGPWPANERMRLTDDGYLGIGTTSPELKLAVEDGGININSLLVDGAGHWNRGLVFTNNSNGMGPWTHAAIWADGVSGFNGELVFGVDGDDKNNMWSPIDPQIQEAMRIDKSGNLGIGTSDPGTNLHVRYSASGHTPTNVGGLFVESGGTSNSSYIFQTATAGGGKSFSITNAGYVGIGTIAPNGQLHIRNTTKAVVNIGGNGNNDKAQLGLFEDSDAGEETGILLAYDGTNNELNLVGYGTGIKEYDLLTIQRDGNIGVGTTTPVEKLTVRGNLLIQSESTGASVLELGEGLDYAEGFDVSGRDKINAGSVLIIDADNPGKLTLSNKSYDTKVAGIVAGGKGLGSGVRLGAGQYDYDVALAGRVYCKVDATYEAIQAGDLLTSSATPGYAMKAVDYTRSHGAILGKAMESLEKGQKGQILVLVTLQ